MAFVETELWRSSRCYIQMRPRLRLAYTALVCSFLPYCTRLAYEYQFKRWPHRLPECAALGLLNGTTLMALCLTWDPAMVLSAGMIGATYGILYSQALKYLTNKVDCSSEGSVNLDS